MLADSEEGEPFSNFAIEKRDSLIDVGHIVTVEEEQQQLNHDQTGQVDRIAARKSKINELKNKKYWGIQKQINDRIKFKMI